MDEEVPISFSTLKEFILKNEFFRFDLNNDNPQRIVFSKINTPNFDLN